MKPRQKGVIYKTLFRLIKLLPPRFKINGIVSFLFLFLNSALDLAGLGTVVPLLIVLLDDKAFEKYAILQEVYNWVGFETKNEFIAFICAGVIGVIIVKNLLSLWIHYYQSRFSYSLQRHFSSQLYRSYYGKGYLYFKSLNSAEIIRNIQAVPNAFAANVLLPLMIVLNELVMIVFIVAGLLVYEAEVLVILAIVVAPTFILFYLGTKRLTRRLAEKQHEIAPYLTKNILESVYGFLDVMVTRTQEMFFSRHERYQADLMGIQTKSQVLKIAPSKILENSLFLGVMTIVVYGTYKYEDQTRLITLLGVFAIAAYRVMPSVNRIMVGVISLNGFRYTIDLIEKELSEDAQMTKKPNTQSLSFDSVIECKKISYQYPEKDSRVIKDLNLKIEKGSVVGFVGKSGSGKSTLTNILLGFIEPTKGQVLIDNQELNASTIDSWRSKIGYVQQEVYLVDGTIRENVAFGQDLDKIDDQKVINALKLASLWDFVTTLDAGVNEEVGERGGKLSGGQKQRVGIARAIYSGAEVLFFDEATSALDNETEREVTEAIHHLADADLTMIIIAHRITTLKFCNHIYEIEDGDIKGETTYAELVDKTV